MIKNVIKEENQKNVWISTTGYRIFFELKLLMLSPKTISEIHSAVQSCPYFKRGISKDTIRFDINTLRAAGCVITNPSKENGHKYILHSHPFNLNISEEELNLMLEVMHCTEMELSLNEVFHLNSLYEKIAALTFDNQIIKTVRNNALLSNLNKDILKEILNPKLLNKKVQMTYKSPAAGIENTDIIPLKIIYSDEKVYIWAHNFKYGRGCLFEASRILKVNSVSLVNENITAETIKVIYEVFGEAVSSFKLKTYEKIIKQTADKITVSAEADSEFMLIQRLMLLGRNFRIIEPDFFREKLINHIKAVQMRYKNE